MEEALTKAACPTSDGAGERREYTMRQKVVVGFCLMAASVVFAIGLYTIGTMLIKGWLFLMKVMTVMGANPFGWSL